MNQAKVNKGRNVAIDLAMKSTSFARAALLEAHTVLSSGDAGHRSFDNALRMMRDLRDSTKDQEVAVVVAGLEAMR